MTSRLHLPMATCTSRPAWTADALNALVFNGYVRPNVEEPDRRRVTWRDAVHLRSVSAACRAAVDNEEFWRLQYGLLRTGKVFSPPAIREVLEHGTASQRPYRDAFALGLRESARTKLTVDDLAGMRFMSRLTASFGTMEERRQRCPWWRGLHGRRQMFAADMNMYSLIDNGGTHGCDTESKELPTIGTWSVVPAPPACSGWYICVVTANEEHGLWKICRLDDWSVILITAGAVKCSWNFRRRHEDPWSHELGVDDARDMCPKAGSWDEHEGEGGQVNLAELMPAAEETPLLTACVEMDVAVRGRVGEAHSPTPTTDACIFRQVSQGTPGSSSAVVRLSTLWRCLAGRRRRRILRSASVCSSLLALVRSLTSLRVT